MGVQSGNSRRAAAFAVARWLATKDFAANLLPAGPDRAFVQDLVYTVLRRRPDFAAGASQESIPFETGHDGAFAASFRRQ